MNKKLSALASVVNYPERRTPTDEEAMKYLDSRMRIPGFTKPHEYLRGKWPALSRDDAHRIARLWSVTRNRSL